MTKEVNTDLLECSIYLLRNSEELTVERYNDVVFVKGRPVEKCEEAFIIKGNVQPITGFELLQVPEGERHRQHVYIYTRDEVDLRDVICRKKCDQRFEIQIIEKWGAFNRIRAVRTDVDRL